MTFTHPVALVLTPAAVAAALVGLRTLAQQRAGDARTYSNLDFLERAVAGNGVPWGRIVAGAWVLAVACFGIALAGPHVTAPVAVRDGAVVLCIDTSGSMAATDLAPSRSEAALRAARAFVDGVPDGTRIGIVSFASAAATIVPVTEDKDAVREGLARVPPPNGGTAIGDALLLAGRTLPPVAHRAIVLMTDGVNNAGSDPLAVAQHIGAGGIGIETIGIGTSGSGLLIPGTAEEADLDEDALRTIAADGHGAYARAADADTLRGRLAELARTSTTERRRLDASFPLAIAGGALLLAGTAGALTLGRYP